MRGGALLLAAGASRRFGSDKRRHLLDDGTPMLVASVRRYAAAFPSLIVVLRPEDDDLAALVAAAADDLDVRVVRCADACSGMGHSLACGARAAASWSYLFVALSDMPWVRPQTLQRLRAALEAAPADAVVRPFHHGHPGHPVGFGGVHLPELATLQGDEGAREVIRRNGRIIRVDVDDPGVLQDLDEPPGEPGKA